MTFTRPYSVLLLRPDYAAEQFGTDTYFAHVRADSREAAIAAAQAEAFTEHQLDDANDPADYAVLLVLHGHVREAQDRATDTAQDAVLRFIKRETIDPADVFTPLDGTDTLHEVEKIADAIAVRSAELSAYLLARGLSGCGDHGDEAGRREMRKACRKVRRALGFTLP